MIFLFFVAGIASTLSLGAVVRAVRSDRRFNAQPDAPRRVLVLEQRRPQPTVVDVQVTDLPRAVGR